MALRTREIVPAILDWFAKNQREMPWRRARDAYGVWISEVMLQQTQVKTVIPYWERWMRELPDVRALAGAREERVLKLWEGLGYYSRARNLQRAARVIVERHGGVFPSEFAAVLDLPGIGRYTAGAICSIAFGQAAPIVDGNVARVLTRVFAMPGDPKSKEVSAKLWERAGELVLEAKAVEACSQLNQGLMELGALVCTPREPKCRVCPLAKVCLARARGEVERFPEVAERVATTARLFQAALIRKGETIVLRQRPAGVVNAGFWELPNVEGKVFGGEPLVTVRHSITRYRMTLEVFASRRAKGFEGTVVSQKEAEELPLVSAHRKALEKLGLIRTRS